MKETSSALVSFDTLKELSTSESVTEKGNRVYWVTEPDQEVPIRLSKDVNNPASLPPRTVMQNLESTVNFCPNRPALCVKRNDIWLKWTYSEYLRDVKRYARSLIRLGVEATQAVSIIGFNSPEWHISDLGAIYAGCIPAGIYTTNGPEACHYIISHSRAAVVMVDDDVQLQKVLSIRDRLPNLKAIVKWLGPVPKDEPGVYDWNSFLALGNETPEAAIQSRINRMNPGSCCTLIYTSGTTGNPKAVMLSHDNLTWTSHIATTTVFKNLDDLTREPERSISFLPLSHVAAQVIDIYLPIVACSTVYFAKPDALKGSLVDTMKEVKPTKFLTVPRVWEKMEEKMRAVGAANTGIIKRLGDWAKSVGTEASKAKLNGEEAPWGWSIANRLVFQTIKKNLGLDECDVLASAAAPISLKTVEYFASLDMQIHEMYGMSETTGPHTLCFPEKSKPGTVGPLIAGAEMKIDNKDDKGHGEICMRGRHVFMGYLHNPEATMEVFDDEGFLHSGDIGFVDSEGFLKITGRIKELLITAGGENVPPVLIEDIIKEELPIINNAMVIGDKRKYLSVLLTLQSEPDSEGRPTNQPSQQCIDFATAAGSTVSTIQGMTTCPKIKEKIEEGIARVNSRATSRAQHLRRWTLLSTDFTVDGGELTPTMKLKRRIVNQKYSDLIEKMYDEVAIPSRL